MDSKKKRVKTRITRPVNALVTTGDQCRMIRELRKYSKAALAEKMGVNVDTITRIENKFWGAKGFLHLNTYLESIGATIVVIPLPFPSYHNHQAVIVNPPKVEYSPTPHNLATDEDGDIILSH
jgi:transcriptional regulator with XRE-family HTH domain